MSEQSRAEAIAKIRALAQDGRGTLLDRVQERIQGVYNEADIEDCLCELEVADCVHDSPPDRKPHHPPAPPDAWVYEFETVYGDDLIYVKVQLSSAGLIVLSFWYKGRASDD